MISFKNYVLEDRQKTSVKFTNLLKKWVNGAKRGSNNDLIALQISKYPVAKESTRGIIGNTGFALRTVSSDDAKRFVAEKKLPVMNKVMSLAHSIKGVQHFEDLRRMNGIVFEIRITHQNALFDAVRLMERVQDATGDYDTFEPYLDEDEVVIASPPLLTLDQAVGTMIGGTYSDVSKDREDLANWEDLSRQ